MKRGMPAVWEEASQLRKLMHQQSDSRLRTRLHLLYLLRTDVAPNRARAAQLLGVGRNTVGRWLHQYERGGLRALLALEQAPRPCLLFAGRGHRRNAGETSRPQRLRLVPRIVAVGRGNLSPAKDILRDLVHRHPGLGRTPRGRTPGAHQKKPDAEACFRATLAHRLCQAALTPTPVKWESELLPRAQLWQPPWPA